MKKFLSLILFVLLLPLFPAMAVTMLPPVEQDPLQAKIFKLDNGITVCLSENRERPDIVTYIGFRTGSASDPESFTGLAHYLEHLLFKGSEQLGTVDFAAENKLLLQIEDLYEQHAKAVDPEERRKLYEQIDRISGEAAHFANANEFNAALEAMGGSRINAYTSVDRTVYLTTIPRNQLSKFLDLQLDRFRSPVFRGFHTELETVYEEYNMSSDDPDRRFWQLVFQEMYPDHPLGRPVIGYPEHLKNPSPRKVMEFYRKHYVPGNMVIVLAGDLDADVAIRELERTFGTLPEQAIPLQAFPQPEPLKGEQRFTLTAPEYEIALSAWRLEQLSREDKDLLALTSRVLFNGAAGLLDQNLNVSQLTTEAFFQTISRGPESALLLLGSIPAEGDSPEHALTLLDGEIEKLKKGEFPDWLLEAVIANLELEQSLAIRDNTFRADCLLEAFLQQEPWPEAALQLERLKKITREQIIDFANRYFTGDRRIFFRRNGALALDDALEKPPITPLPPGKNPPSSFFLELMRRNVPEIQPEFPDLSGKILKDAYEVKGNITFQEEEILTSRCVELEMVENPENDYFVLRFIFDVGRDNDRRWPLVADYSGVCGLNNMSPEEFQSALYKLAGSISLSAGADRTELVLRGLRRNLPETLALANALLENAAENPSALAALVNKTLLIRRSELENPESLLFDYLVPYVKYGSDYFAGTMLAEEELRKIEARELTGMLKNLKKYPLRILYYGPDVAGEGKDELKQVLGEMLPLPLPQQRPPKAFRLTEQSFAKKVVYFLPLPNQAQAQLLFLARGSAFSAENIGERMLFNACYGGGMSSMLFKHLREEQSLCYSCFANYQTPARPERSFYFYTFLATQNDKVGDAILAVQDLGFSLKSATLEHFRTQLLKKLSAERWKEEALFTLSEEFRTMGLPSDFREQTFRKLESTSIAEVVDFYQQEVASLTNVLLLVGDPAAINMEVLAQYGPVIPLTLPELSPILFSVGEEDENTEEME